MLLCLRSLLSTSSAHSKYGGYQRVHRINNQLMLQDECAQQRMPIQCLMKQVKRGSNPPDYRVQTNAGRIFLRSRIFSAITRQNNANCTHIGGHSSEGRGQTQGGKEYPNTRAKKMMNEKQEDGQRVNGPDNINPYEGENRSDERRYRLEEDGRRKFCPRPPRPKSLPPPPR